jgi:two-component system, chemotaxis family, chemotaxis protein CheY
MIKILLVDDDNIIIKTMHKIFGQYGECTSVESGTQAIEAFTASLQEHKPFDLIILDISLDDKSGMEVLKKIRDMEEDKNISKEKRVKIVMATGNRELKTVKECIAQGCDNYILKPLKPDFVEEVLGKFGFTRVEKNDQEEDTTQETE